MPTVRATPSIVVGNGVTEINIPKPPGLADGDEVLIVLSWEDVDPGVVVPPTGFTGAYLTTGTPRVPIYRAVKPITNAAGEPANYTPTWDNAHKVNAIGMAVVDADTSNPINAEGFNDDGSNDTTATLNGITTTVDGCLLIEIFVAETANRTITTGPSGATSLGSASQGGAGADVSTHWWSDSQPTAGATGNQDATWSGNSQGTNGIIAIAPPAAGGGVEVALAPATIASSAVAQVLSLTALATELVPVSLVSSAQALSPSLAPLAVPLTPAALSLSAQAQVLSLGALATELSPASIALIAQALSPDIAGAPVEVTLAPASLVLTAQALSPQITGIGVSIELVPASLLLGPQALSLSLTGLQTEIVPASLTVVPQALSIAQAPLEISLSPASITISPQALGLDLVALVVPLSPATISLLPQVLLPPLASVTVVLVPAELAIEVMEMFPEIQAVPIPSGSEIPVIYRRAHSGNRPKRVGFRRPSSWR